MFKYIIRNRLVLRFAIYNWLLLKYRKVQYETYPRISGKLFVAGGGTLKLGKKVRLNSCLAANPIGGDSRIILSVSENALMQIGDHTGISNSALVCKENIYIGKNVYIGGGVKIYDSDFHSLNVDTRVSREHDVPKTAPVYISDGAFIGAHSIILKGVHIGLNAIVGAGSVVSKSIPENEIWAGNPAKFIKKMQ